MRPVNLRIDTFVFAASTAGTPASGDGQDVTTYFHFRTIGNLGATA